MGTKEQRKRGMNISTFEHQGIERRCEGYEELTNEMGRN